MQTYIKVVACLIRENNGEKQILSFVHPPPLNDYQIPKGTVEKGENLEIAALRELYEESGISNCEIEKYLGSFELITEGGTNRELPLEKQIWHVYTIKANEPLSDSWEHIVSGKGIDKGLVYKYFWHNWKTNNSRFHHKFHRLFHFIENTRPN